MLQFQNVEAGMQVIILCTTALCPCCAPPSHYYTLTHIHTHNPRQANSLSRDRIINVKRFHLALGLSLSVSLSLSISFKLQASKLGQHLLYINSVSHYTSLGNALIVVHFGTCIQNNSLFHILQLKLTATVHAKEHSLVTVLVTLNL